jgi:trans-2,3-dihydro-3-hydroxyanthranilate isomerase
VDLPFRLLDVFAERPFEGNQLCVVPEAPAELETQAMQTLAREIGFSETTFVTRTDPGGYDIRIFTPIAELPFAGHPTVGTAFLLAAEGRTGTSVIQHCGAGEVPVEVDLAAGRAIMRQLPPAFRDPLTDRAAVATAAGLAETDLADLPIEPVSVGIWHVMVPVANDEALRRASRDDRRCRELLTGDLEALYLFSVRAPGDVRARMFDRDAAIGEDPATGSAAGPLGAYLSAHGLAGMPGQVAIAQGEQVGRPSLLHVETAPDADTWTVRVGGGVHVVGEGSFRL